MARLDGQSRAFVAELLHECEMFMVWLPKRGIDEDEEKDLREWIGDLEGLIAADGMAQQDRERLQIGVTTLKSPLIDAQLPVKADGQLDFDRLLQPFGQIKHGLVTVLNNYTFGRTAVAPSEYL